MDVSDADVLAGLKLHVECDNPECRAFGPDGMTPEEAVKKWNSRHSSWNKLLNDLKEYGESFQANSELNP